MDLIESYLAERAAPGALIGVLEDGTRIRQAKPSTGRASMETIRADELMTREFERLHAPVQGLIVEGLTLLCGASKIGKSWLVLALCCAVAAGKPFLGRSTESGDVLYLALEDSPRRLQTRLRTLGEKPDGRLTLATRAHALDDGLLFDLEDWVGHAAQPRMIVIDTLQKIRGAAPSARVNAYADDYAVIGRLKAFADAHHLAVVLVHHLRKSADSEDPFDRISGTTGLMGAADTSILIARGRNSSDATVSFTGRDVWGNDFPIRMQGGRWQAVSPEALARETYESNPIVLTCRALLRGGGPVKISLQMFLDAGAREVGLPVAATKNELSRSLDALAPKLREYDGILLVTGKRVGNERGLILNRKGDSDDD